VARGFTHADLYHLEVDVSSGGRICTTGQREGGTLRIKVVVHEAEEGGYWAEVPAIPGCVTQGETMEELMANVHEAHSGLFGR
jgi:hypothetical protein